MSKTRKLIVACDGTWNDPEQLDGDVPAPTNVFKFKEARLKKNTTQLCHYEKGVGTRAWETVPGGVYGYGLDKRILGSYRFLRTCFRDKNWAREDNRIFLIGFSRGSYTVRRLAGLINFAGIPVKTTDVHLGWELYLKNDTRSIHQLKSEGRFFDFPIEFLGVWDTVKGTNDHDFNDNVLSPNVVAGCHAMAIDEKRKVFPVLRWNRDPRALQVWFAGVHSDIGGGYANSGLSDIAFKWMLQQAAKHGLEFSKSYIQKNIKPRPRADQHDSFQGIWKVLGKNERKVLKTDWVHNSVAQRIKKRTKKPLYRATRIPRPLKIWPPAS